MNALAPRAVPADLPSNRIDQVSRALANQRDKLEAPFREVERICRLGTDPLHVEGIESAIVAAMRRASLSAPARLPRAGDFRHVERSQHWLANGLSAEEMGRVRRMILAGIETQPDPATARITLGLLLDAFPNAGREVKDGFFAALLHDVIEEGYSPHVLAETSRRIRRAARFLPTIGEVLAQCASAKSELETGLAVLDQLITAREALQACVDAYERPAEEWTRDEWEAAAMAFLSVRGETSGWPAHLGPPPGEPGCKMPLDVIHDYGLAREAA